MPHADYLDRSTWNAVCSLCGGKYKASELRLHWQGMRRCAKCWEVRQPQDFVKGGPPEAPPPWVQPPTDDYVQVCDLYSISGVPAYMGPACAIPGQPFINSGGGGSGGGGGGSIILSGDFNPVFDPFGVLIDFSLLWTLSGPAGLPNYDVMKSFEGGSFSLLSSVPDPGTTYTDSATFGDGTYSYKIIRGGDSSNIVSYISGNESVDPVLGNIIATWSDANVYGVGIDEYQIFALPSLDWNGNADFSHLPYPTRAAFSPVGSVSATTFGFTFHASHFPTPCTYAYFIAAKRLGSVLSYNGIRCVVL